MKKITFTFVLFFFYLVSHAQDIRSLLPSPAFSNALGKIVLDFRFGYHTIQIDSLSSEENGYEAYASSVTLPGSTDNEILRFHSVQDTTATFQASFYQGDDQNEAVKSYKSCIHLLKKSLFNWFDRTPVSFSGKEEAPDPNLSFASTTLRVNNKDDKRYKNFCAEVEMAGDVNGWKVYIIFEVKPLETDAGSDN
jgi:hypothetical protein